MAAVVYVADRIASLSASTVPGLGFAVESYPTAAQFGFLFVGFVFGTITLALHRTKAWIAVPAVSAVICLAFGVMTWRNDYGSQRMIVADLWTPSGVDDYDLGETMRRAAASLKPPIANLKIVKYKPLRGEPENPTIDQIAGMTNSVAILWGELAAGSDRSHMTAFIKWRLFHIPPSVPGDTPAYDIAVPVTSSAIVHGSQTAVVDFVALYSSALIAFSSERYSEAADRVKAALNDASAINHDEQLVQQLEATLALADMYAGRFSDARSAARATIRGDKDLLAVGGLLQMAQLSASQCRYAEAKGYAVRALAIMKTPEVYESIASQDVYLGQLHAALASLHEAEKVAKVQDPQLYLSLAFYYYAQRDYGNALLYFRKASVFPNPEIRSISLSGEGNALDELGEIDDAIAVYKEAITFDESNANAWENFGVLEFKSSHMDDAIAKFKRALEIEPKYALAAQWLCKSYYRQWALSEAMDACSTAIAIEPHVVDPYWIRSYIYALRGDAQDEKRNMHIAEVNERTSACGASMRALNVND